MISATRSSFPSATVMWTTSTYDTGFSSRCPLRGGDRGRDRAESVDLDRDLVTGLQPHLRVAERTDTGGRAGDDQIARLERYRLRDERDDLSHAEDLIRGVRVLHHLPVQDRSDRKCLRIRNLARRHDLGDRQERVEGLPAHPLPVRELQVARRD